MSKKTNHQKTQHTSLMGGKRSIGLFQIEKKPQRGLLPVEWAVMGYLLFTLAVIFFTYTKLQHPDALIWARLRVVAMTAALWAVYRMVPCRFTLFARVGAQVLLLAWWYPDTYELNRVLPNLDHVFATAEQSLFGCQPALSFAAAMPSAVVSELMSLGYASYYPMIAVVILFYFFRRYEEFGRCVFIIMASFFLFYVIFVLVPVTGPTFYYKAVGLEKIAQGIFPNVHDYFNTHQDCLPTPGYANGFFYQLVESAKDTGERPTAAFPSSHVGVATVCLLLAWHARSWRLVALLAPLYVLLCLATVYIQAHYAIDAIAGLFIGGAFFAALLLVSKRFR